MKTLFTIIALALTMTVAGQDTVRYRSNIVETIYPDAVIKAQYDLMKAYVQECYADTVVRSGWRYVETGMVGGCHKYTVWMEPRAYPTFEGYYKWLEKLLK